MLYQDMKRSRSSEARKTQDENSTEGSEHVKREEQLEGFKAPWALHLVSMQRLRTQDSNI